MNLPGREEAEKLGYTMYAFGADRDWASYWKDGLFLTCRGDTAELSAIRGLVEIKVHRFQFPNKNFRIFENAISDVLGGFHEQR